MCERARAVLRRVEPLARRQHRLDRLVSQAAPRAACRRHRPRLPGGGTRPRVARLPRAATALVGRGAQTGLRAGYQTAPAAQDSHAAISTDFFHGTSHLPRSWSADKSLFPWCRHAINIKSMTVQLNSGMYPRCFMRSRGTVPDGRPSFSQRGMTAYWACPALQGGPSCSSCVDQLPTTTLRRRFRAMSPLSGYASAPWARLRQGTGRGTSIATAWLHGIHNRGGTR